MRPRRRPLLITLAAVLVAGLAQLSAPAAAAALPARTLSPASAGATGPLDPLVPDAASLAAMAAQLPADPIDAAEALVGTIFGADDVAAVAATGELLRRAGLPLVSAAGPVVALPDGLTIITDPLYVEQLPALTRAVRDHTEFTPAQLSDTLQYIGVTTTGLPAPVVVGMLAAWGKDADAPRESAFAGAAVRALAVARGELLVPAALVDDTTLATLADDPGSLSQHQLALLAAPGRLSGLDPVQFLLAVAHASGKVVGGATAVPGSPAPPGLRRPDVAAGTDCESLKETPEEGRAVGKKILRDDIKAGAEMVKKDAGKAFDEAFDTYDKGTDVVATTMLLMGATIDLVASPPTTHFRHESGDPSRDVLFVANAAFSGPIAAKRLACWSLAGVDVPPNGPLNGFRVRWAIHDSLPVLQTKHADSEKLLNGELTKDGVSTLWTYPRTETHPPKAGQTIAEHTITAIVVASLDKDDFPFKLTDLLGMADPEAAALGKVWDIAVAWMQRVGLPSKRIKYPVSYHANSPYVINAHTTMEAFGFANVVLDTDLYSCDGPGGPWKGTVTLTGSAEAILVAAGRLVGADTSKTAGSVSFPMNFMLNEKASAAQQVPFGKDLALVIGLYPDQVQVAEHPQTLNDTWDRLGNQAIVGDGSFLSGGIDMRQVAQTTAGGLIQGAEYQVVGVMRDDRCPGASYWDDRFDND